MTLHGTDMSIAVCRLEGYAVVHGHDGRMNPNKAYRITISNPRAWNSSGTARKRNRYKAYAADRRLSYRELYQMVQESPGLQSYADVKSIPFPKPEEASFSDLATIAGVTYTYTELP